MGNIDYKKLYGFAVKNIKKALQKDFDLAVEVESKSFTRFKIDGLLKIDFVNDIAARYKNVKVLDNKYIISSFRDEVVCTKRCDRITICRIFLFDSACKTQYFCKGGEL